MKKFIFRTDDWLQMLNTDGDIMTLYGVATGYEMFLVVEAEDEDDPVIYDLLDEATKKSADDHDFRTWYAEELTDEMYERIYNFIAAHEELDWKFNRNDMQTSMFLLRGEILRLFCQRFLLGCGLEGLMGKWCYVSNDHKRILCDDGHLYNIECLALPFFGHRPVVANDKAVGPRQEGLAIQTIADNCIVEEVDVMPAILGRHMFNGYELWQNKPENKVHPMARPD